MAQLASRLGRSRQHLRDEVRLDPSTAPDLVLTAGLATLSDVDSFSSVSLPFKPNPLSAPCVPVKSVCPEYTVVFAVRTAEYACLPTHAYPQSCTTSRE
jgi:hypothetical protein